MPVDKSLIIGLLYDSKQDITDFIHSLPGNIHHDFIYHWREAEEIQAITVALKQLGHEVVDIGSLENFIERKNSLKHVDLIWNVSIRAISRNRTALAPALLELLQIPYTGCDATNKSFTLNKDLLKPFLQHQAILTPEWIELNHTQISKIPTQWDKFIVKPVAEGYSLGVKVFTVTDSPEELLQHTRSIHHQLNQNCIAEEFISGREIHISIVEGLEQHGVLETLLADGSALGNEYLDTNSKREIIFTKAIPAPDDPGIQQALKTAQRLFKRVAPLDYATFDFRIDEKGNAYLIDVNADATLHPERTLALSFSLAGISYKHVIQAICNSVLSRWSKQDVQQLASINLS